MVSLAILMSFVILICGLISHVQSSKSDLTIGLILDAKDDVSENLVNLAVQMANAELLDSNYRLLLKTETIEDNASFYSIRKACGLIENGLVAIISHIDAIPSRHISSLCTKFQIPHLITSCRFPESLEAYSMDVRVSPDCNQYAKILYQYVTRVENWRSVIIIHSSNDCIIKFENLINQFESRLILRQWVHRDLKKNKDLMRQLTKLKDFHNFLVDIPYWQIKQFLIMASVHNLTEPHHSFIFTDWDASFSELAAFKINNEMNITAFSIVNNTAIDQMKIELLHPRISRLRNVSSKQIDIKSISLARTAILFDSVRLLVRGITRLSKLRDLGVTALSCSENNTWSLGSSLVNSITSIDDMHGTTGNILFNERALREEYSVSIIELTEDGFVKSGYWSDHQITILPKIKHLLLSENSNYTSPLRVTTKIETPFVFYGDPLVHDNFDTDPSAWKGYCIDLLQHIGKDLGLNFTIHVVADNTYGVSKENETNPDGTEIWTGLIGELMTKKADLAVAPMTITYERERVVDFTTPFMGLGLSILFLRPKTEAPGLFSFLTPLSPPVWIYVLSAYVGVSVIICIISYITPYERLHFQICYDENKKQNQFHLLNSLWFAVGALVRQGCDIAPQAPSTRTIVGAWWFFTLIIISTYTANLAAFLTVEQLILPIKNAEDLANQTRIKYGTLKGGASFAFFAKALIPTYQKMYKFMESNSDVLQDDVNTGINRVLGDNGKYAFLMESSWIDYYVQKHCNLMRVGDLLDSKGYGIGFPAGSPLRDRFSISILKLQKNQILDTLKHQWWTELNNTETCNSKDQGKLPAPLNVYQVGGVFILWGIGFSIGALISVLEAYINYYFKLSQCGITFTKFVTEELRFAMRFMSSSKKPKQKKITRTKGKELSIFENSGSQHPDFDANTIPKPSVYNDLNSPSSIHRNLGFIEHNELDTNEIWDGSVDGFPRVQYPGNFHTNI